MSAHYNLMYATIRYMFVGPTKESFELVRFQKSGGQVCAEQVGV